MILRLTDEEKQEKLKEFIAEYGEKEGFNIYNEMLNWQTGGKYNEVRQT
jgi:hypothetical protein